MRRELDRLFNKIDALMDCEKYNEVDQFLLDFDVDSESTTMLVGVLTATCPEFIRSKLKNRDILYSRIENRLKEIEPDRVERLIGILK